MNQESITLLLQRVSSGERELLNDIYSRLYAEIKTIAQYQINKLDTGQTITPTVLAHDCYLKIVKQNNINMNTSKHFLNCLSISMRQLLIDVHRAKQSSKRAFSKSTENFSQITGEKDVNFKILELDQLLNKIEKINHQCFQILSYKLILSMTFVEIAHALDKSERQIIRLWKKASALLMALSSQQNQGHTDKQES